MPPLRGSPIPFDRIPNFSSTPSLPNGLSPLHDAWREYAAKAARPYAWKTFALYARRQLMQSGDWSSEHGQKSSLHGRRGRAPLPAFSSLAHMPLSAFVARA